MKTVKHFWIICLALAALLALSVGAAAQTTVSYCGAQGDNVRWELDGSGNLSLTGAGAIQDFSVSPWSSRGVKKVTIGEGITRIGSHAFSDCKSIVDVTLPQTLTSIGREAFSSCTGIRRIALPAGVTSVEEFAFINCSNLKDICIDSLEAWCAISFESANANPLYPSRFLNLNGQRITALTVPEGVTAIGDFAFYECREFRKITLPESLERIGEYAFAGCRGLTELALPDAVTYIGLNAFRDCSSIGSLSIGKIIGEKTLDELYIPTDNLKGVYITEGADAIAANAFKDCPKLASVSIPTTMRTVGKDAFFNCKSLRRVDITSVADWCLIDFACPYSNPLHRSPKLFLNDREVFCLTVPEGVTKIKNYAFYQYTGLKILCLPEGLTSIGEYAFYRCTALTGLILPDSVTTLGKEAFRGCAAMTLLTIGDGLANLDRDVFTDCSAINTLTIGLPAETKTLDDLTVPKANIKFLFVRKPVAAIAANAFKDCGKLEAVSIPETVTAIGKDAFFNCRALKCVNIESLESWLGIDFACPYSNPLMYAHHVFTDKKEIFVLEIPEEFTAVKDYAFYGFSSMRKLVLPETLETIGAYAFTECTGLTELKLPAGVTALGDAAFRGCSQIRKLTLGQGPETFGHDVFTGCSAIADLTIGAAVETYTLDDLTIPKANLKMVRITEPASSITANAFKDCTNLTAVFIPETVTAIKKDAFFNCKNLKAAHITDLTAWCGILFTCPYSNPLETAHHLFLNGAEVKALVIPSGVTKINDYAFYNDTGLKSVSFPTNVTAIGDYAFQGCTGLLQISVPETATKIGAYAFRGCSNLFEATIPVSVTNIGQGAFANCGKLKDLYFSGSEEQWKAIATGGKDPGLTKNTTIHFDTFPAVMLGDVDNDGKVTPADARTVLRRSVGLEDYASGTERYLASDADRDNAVTSADARIILRMAVGLSS